MLPPFSEWITGLGLGLLDSNRIRVAGEGACAEAEDSDLAFPSPATHWARLQLKAGETVCKTPFGSKTV